MGSVGLGRKGMQKSALEPHAKRRKNLQPNHTRINGRLKNVGIRGQSSIFP